MRDRLSVALVSSAQLTRELAVPWLKKVANCRIDIFSTPSDVLPRRGDGDGDGYDLVVVGYFLHGGSGAQLLACVDEVRERLPDLPLVIIARAHEDALITETLRRGARAYIPTRLPVPVAIAAVKLVLAGGTFAPPVLGKATAPAPAAPAGPPEPEAPRPPLPPLRQDMVSCLNLSPRECEVLLLLQHGRSNRRIAEELAISQNTVVVHVRHLMRKLGARNRTEAVIAARRVINSAPKTSA